MPEYLDSVAIEKAKAFRAAKNEQLEYSQVLNDEAFQLEIAANNKRMISNHLIDELNEGVPNPYDPYITPAWPAEDEDDDQDEDEESEHDEDEDED